MSKQPKNSAQKQQDERLDKALSEKRWCYVIMEFGGFVPKQGYRVCVAIEGEAGCRPTGNLDVLSDDPEVAREAYRRGGTLPWFWGMTYEEARKNCEAENEKLGYTPTEAMLIVASTMEQPKHRRAP